LPHVKQEPAAGGSFWLEIDYNRAAQLPNAAFQAAET